MINSYVLFHLDMQELLFHGSACQSGIRPSHVLEQMSVEDLKNQVYAFHLVNLTLKMIFNSCLEENLS
jgi:hypothetical protein